MILDSKRTRPLFTMIFFALGGYVGNAGASWYLKNITGILNSDSTLLNIVIPQNPTHLTSNDKMWLRLSCVIVGALLGFIIERLVFIQYKTTRSRWELMSPQEKGAFFAGIILGLLLTVLIRNILSTNVLITVCLAVALCYVSVTALESVKEQLRFYFPGAIAPSKADLRGSMRPKLLDTNVIIDGRVADICRAGFLEGPIFVPKFILEELQMIADSSDSLRRARGRRGLDILHQMQKEISLEVTDLRADKSDEEVDARLVMVARELSGSIVTNDYNLNKVAELQGVQVLNINELANALKPVVLPGEEMHVTIIKEGKEKDQGVGYLDDGTMIVVEGARRLIGDTLDVNVTSVLQTVQGKMIFAKTRELDEQGNDTFEDSVRSYTGSRTRRKIR